MRWYAAGLAATVLAATLCSCGPDRSHDARALPERTYPDWEAFLQEDVATSPVYVIGIDGAAWPIIDRMIGEGGLPTLSRLKREGASGTLRSVQCYVSPPAWTTLFSGCGPSKTGIHTFGHWDPATRRFVEPRSEDVRVPRVWDVASLAGRRVAVVNVPLTFPVQPVNGIMLSGLMTPSVVAEGKAVPLTFTGVARPAGERGEASRAIVDYAGYRLELVIREAPGEPHVTVRRIDGAAEEPLGTFAVDRLSPWMSLAAGDRPAAQFRLRVESPIDGHYVAVFSPLLVRWSESTVPSVYPPVFRQTLVDTLPFYYPSVFLEQSFISHAAADAVRSASVLWSAEAWDLFAYVFTQSDNVQHLDGLSDITREVYRHIDGFFAWLTERMPDGAHLVIVSDHGFKAYRNVIDLNRVLERLGVLRFNDAGEIDHERTLAFHNLWCLYFNHAQLTPQALRLRGIEPAANESARAALMRYLRNALGDFTWQGKPYPVHLEHPDARGSDGADVGSRGASARRAAGDRDSTQAPDAIVTGTYGDYIVGFWNVDRPGEAVVSPLGANETWNHTREGIYLLWGPLVRVQGTAQVLDAADITPTVLYLMGLPVAANLDGRVPGSLFVSDGAFAHPLVRIDSYDALPPSLPLQSRERQDLEKKLRSLGYIR